MHQGVASELHDWAGVSGKVTILRGKSFEFFPSLAANELKNGADLIFIDHWKDAYLPDIKLLEQHKIVRKGTTVVADNILFPGAPEYLAYVQASDRYTTTLEKSFLEYNETIEDAVAISYASY